MFEYIRKEKARAKKYNLTVKELIIAELIKISLTIVAYIFYMAFVIDILERL